MEMALRTHCDLVEQEDLLNFIKDKADRWFIVLEKDAKRPHYQAYVQFKPKYKSENSLRNLYRKVLKETGNRSYSLKPVREETYVYLCYLLKEGNVISQEAITKTELQQAEARQVEILEARKRQENKKSTSILAQIAEVLPPRHMTRQEMAPYVLKWFLDRKRLVPDQMLFKRYLYTIELWRNPTQVVDYLRTIFEYDSPPTLDRQAEWLEFFSQE